MILITTDLTLIRRLSGGRNHDRMTRKPRWITRFAAFVIHGCRDLPGSIERTIDRNHSAGVLRKLNTLAGDCFELRDELLCTTAGTVNTPTKSSTATALTIRFIDIAPPPDQFAPPATMPRLRIRLCLQTNVESVSPV